MKKITSTEEYRIKFAITDKIMFFSPTISPSPKNIETNEIESLSVALQYFKEYNSNKVIIQPKYMGSYCDIYLKKNINESTFFSRSGRKIRNSLIPQEKLCEISKFIHDKFDWSNISTIIIQAELLPWRALGNKIIENNFESYIKCHEYNLNYLQSSDLNSKLILQKNSQEFKDYKKDLETLDKKALEAKYPQHIIRQYNTLDLINITDLNSYSKSIDSYNEQLEIYTIEQEPYFKPFNILKTIYDDGSEIINESNIDGFQKVSDDQPLILDLNNYNENDAYDYFKKLTIDNKMEGVIVKPDFMWNHEIVPMFKVRNNNYLQMIYNIDFFENYNIYFEKRRVGSKMKCSRNEWKISHELLKIPAKDISEDNSRYVSLVKKRILEEEYETKLDPRL